MSRRVSRSMATAATFAALATGLAACDAGSPVVDATTPPALSGPTEPVPTDEPVSPAPTTDPPTVDPSARDTRAAPTETASPDPSGGRIHKVPGKLVPNDDGRKAAPDGRTWKLKLVDGEVPDRTWPDAERLFSDSELKAIFPDAKSITTRNCLKSNYLGAGGNQTTHRTECELVIQMPGDSAGLPSKLRVRMSGFGPKQDQLERWDRSTSVYAKLAQASTGSTRTAPSGRRGCSPAG